MHEEEQREIEAMGVWPVLRGKLWHATSIATSAGIIEEGLIRIGDTSTYKSSHYQDEFPDEQPILADFRLLVRRPIHGKDGKEIEGMLFRHDKVMDFFLYHAFAADLQQNHLTN